jgi:hypothetical protein
MKEVIPLLCLTSARKLKQFREKKAMALKSG